jgi:hypothetical protein
MENYKKIGKSSQAKHLRKKKGKWTKLMANGKSRSKSKLDIRKSEQDKSSTEDTRKKWSDFKSAPKEKAII